MNSKNQHFSPDKTSAQHSPESERLILSAALTPGEGRDKMRAQLFQALSYDDFFIEQHGGIWQTLRSLHEAGHGLDPASLIATSEKRNIFIGGAPYILGLLDSPIHRAASDTAINAAADRIKSLSLLRKLEQTLTNGRMLCTKGMPFEHVMRVVDDDMKNLAKSIETNKAGPQHLRNFMAPILDQLQAGADGQAQINATSTGLPGLDGIITGLADEELIILAARPSMGKTAFALHLAEEAASNGNKSVLMFSLEMSGESLTRRIMARKCRITLNRIRRNELIESDWERLVEGTEQLGQTELYIDDTPGLTLPEIRARARRFKVEHPKCLIVLDYLQIVASDGNKDQRVHVSEVSGGLKQLAREIEAPVVALSQLSRALEARVNKRPMISDLRDSGAIEQDADLILLLYRDEYYNKDSKEPGVAEIIVGKQRDGQTGTVKTLYQGEIMHYTCMGEVHSG